MPDSFRAFMLSDTGTPRGRFVSSAIDDLDAGDVLVRVAWSGINYKDALAATGKGRILRRSPCIGGIDFSGVVYESSDPRFAPGDAVAGVGFELGVSHHGGYAEFARVPGDWLVTLPATLSPWEAMACGTAGFTAALAVIRLGQHDVTPGSGPVLVSGATGGVGSIAIAALARLGHHVVALTGKPQEREYLEAIGATEVLARDAVDLREIKPLGKATWAGAVDNLGGDLLAWILSTTRMNGVVASIGLAQSAALHTTVMPFILRGVSLLGINSSDAPSQAQRLDAWRRLATDLKPDLKTMTRTIAFDEMPASFEQFINGQIRGRVVVQIAEF